MDEQLELPEQWNISARMEFIIGTLADNAGSFVPPVQLCVELYPDDENDDNMIIPPKLRVMVLECRKALDKHTSGKVKIIIGRNKGYKISKAGFIALRNVVEAAT